VLRVTHDDESRPATPPATIGISDPASADTPDREVA
jgi:hypothetical protein